MKVIKKLSPTEALCEVVRGGQLREHKVPLHPSLPFGRGLCLF